jgi:hypothetical protein
VKLGSSVSAQRAKDDIVDATNHEQHLVIRPPKPPVAEVLISYDKMSELVRLVRQNRTTVKEDKGTPKKKRAQRRKSHTGVQVAPRIVVDRLTATLSSIADVVRQLSERQLGLDVTNITFEESAEGLVAVGGRTGRSSPNPRSKRLSVEYNGGHLLSETSGALESFLRRIGHTDSEVGPLLTSFTSKQSNVVKTEAPVKAKEVKQQVSEVKKADAKSKKSELRGSPKVSKAKTRTVKPRTSNE